MARSGLLYQAQPLIGVVLGGGGWALSHQWGSNSVFDDCASTGGVVVVLTSLLGLAIAAFGALCCYDAFRSEHSGRRFLGIIGLLLTLIAGFAIVLQIAAGIILAPCAG
ncbi:MAG TPA: hypothetical protein VEB68_01415 [Croceibacterium sp.]|nr:hypothetical protein [Croceibacterium sp.]